MPTSYSYLTTATSSLSSLLTTTTSKYTSIRQSILPLSSDERDGDTEDDTHVTRVLRAYYTEKSKPFPSWLPPDPRSAQRPGSHSNNSSWGRPGVAAAGGARPGAGTSRGLSDLFGPPSGGSAGTTPTGSLRRGGQGQAQPQGQGQGQGQGLYPTLSGNGDRPATSPTGSAVRPSPFSSQSQQQQPPSSQYLSPNATPSGARPLPSQREGSYQSLRLGRQVSPLVQGGGQGQGQGDQYGGGGDGGSNWPPPAPPPAGNTAQDRLKAKLWGGSGGRR